MIVELCIIMEFKSLYYSLKYFITSEIVLYSLFILQIKVMYDIKLHTNIANLMKIYNSDLKQAS